MKPISFPEANVKFHAPDDLDESQVFAIDAYRGAINQGNLDGGIVVVTGWLPTPEELAELNVGKPVYLSMLGGLMPHFLSTDIKAATMT